MFSPIYRTFPARKNHNFQFINSVENEKKPNKEKNLFWWQKKRRNIAPLIIQLILYILIIQYI